MVRHQLCHTAAHRASKPFDSIQRHISLTTLNIADASPVQTGTLGKLLLRHSMVFANRSQTMAEALIESHPANDAGILFRVYSVGCTSSGCDIFKNSDSFGLTKKRSGCLIIRHKIAETGSFRQDMQKSGSGHVDGTTLTATKARRRIDRRGRDTARQREISHGFATTCKMQPWNSRITQNIALLAALAAQTLLRRSAVILAIGGVSSNLSPV